MQQPTIDILEWMQNKTQPSILDHYSPGSPVRGSYSSFKKRRDGRAGCLGRMICQRFAGFISGPSFVISDNCGMRDASSGSIALGLLVLIFPRSEVFQFVLQVPALAACLRHLWCRIDFPVLGLCRRHHFPIGNSPIPITCVFHDGRTWQQATGNPTPQDLSSDHSSLASKEGQKGAERLRNRWIDRYLEIQYTEWDEKYTEIPD